MDGQTGWGERVQYEISQLKQKILRLFFHKNGITSISKHVITMQS
ncbi:MAG: hypothetical protein VX737_03720 [Pseudomonadota bacterium]|nr:hypothetical protein [Pseudomonadota bacterium]